jgi:hypothetical protein
MHVRAFGSAAKTRIRCRVCPLISGLARHEAHQAIPRAGDAYSQTQAAAPDPGTRTRARPAPTLTPQPCVPPTGPQDMALGVREAEAAAAQENERRPLPCHHFNLVRHIKVKRHRIRRNRNAPAASFFVFEVPMRCLPCVLVERTHGTHCTARPPTCLPI